MEKISIKRNRILAIVFLLLANSFFGCEDNNDGDNELPKCVMDKIENIKSQQVWSPPAEVWKWEVDGDVYYYFTSNCCDQFNILYNQDCKRVCAPDGGFTGSGDGMCPDFQGEIKKTLVWKDERK